METLIAALIAVGITLFFVRGYLKQLTHSQKAREAPGPGPANAPARRKPCPRCGTKIEYLKVAQRGTFVCPKEQVLS